MQGWGNYFPPGILDSIAGYMIDDPLLVTTKVYNNYIGTCSGSQAHSCCADTFPLVY